MFIAILATSAAGEEAYRVGSKDLLRFAVHEVPSLNVTARVDPMGSVTLPLMGALEVTGLTPVEIGAKLQQLLESRYVQRATVTVTVEEYLARSVNVVGAVQRPGPIGLEPGLTLTDAILRAGSVREDHAGVVQVVRRASNGVTAQLDFEVSSLIDGTNARADIPLASNDLVRIPVASSVTVYLLGEIASRGPITFESGERPTLLAAIARAGGLTDRASKQIRVKRNRAEPNSPEAILEVDYKDLVNARIADVELEDGDVIVVRESFF